MAPLPRASVLSSITTTQDWESGRPRRGSAAEEEEEQQRLLEVSPPLAVVEGV